MDDLLRALRGLEVYPRLEIRALQPQPGAPWVGNYLQPHFNWVLNSQYSALSSQPLFLSLMRIKNIVAYLPLYILQKSSQAILPSGSVTINLTSVTPRWLEDNLLNVQGNKYRYYAGSQNSSQTETRNILNCFLTLLLQWYVCVSLPTKQGLKESFAIIPASESTCEYPVSTSLFPLLTI